MLFAERHIVLLRRTATGRQRMQLTCICFFCICVCVIAFVFLYSYLHLCVYFCIDADLCCLAERNCLVESYNDRAAKSAINGADRLTGNRPSPNNWPWWSTGVGVVQFMLRSSSSSFEFLSNPSLTVTNCCLVHLIVVTLADEDVNSKVVYEFANFAGNN